MNIRTINAVEEIGQDLEKAMMMATEVKDNFLDTVPPDANDQRSREDFLYKMALEIERFNTYGSIMIDYLIKAENALGELRNSLSMSRPEMNELAKNVEVAMFDAADLMEAITNGAATGEMIKNNAEVAHDFLQSALYDFTQLVKGPGAHEPSEYQMWEQRNVRKVEVVQ